MKTAALWIHIIVFLSMSCNVNAQRAWTTYLEGFEIRDIEFDGKHLWCAAKNSVIRWDVYEHTYVEYLPSDGIPDGFVWKIAVGQNGEVWCGANSSSGVKLAQFDGEKWIGYTIDDGIEGGVSALAVESDSDLICATYRWDWNIESYHVAISRFDGETWATFTPVDFFDPKIVWKIVYSIAVHPNGDIWCGTGAWGIGIYRYDGSSWTHYTTDDGLLDNDIMSIAVGPDDDIWCGRYDGVSRFDGERWIAYEYESVGDITDMTVDAQGDLWCGIYGKGVVRFDGESWVRYTIDDELPSKYVTSVAKGNDNKLYFGTQNGIAIFDKSTTLVETQELFPSQYTILNNHPNPFNPSTTIEFTLPESGFATLSIYNISGQKVRDLAAGYMTAGAHSLTWDGRDDSGDAVSSGVYITRLVAGKQVAAGRMVFLK